MKTYPYKIFQYGKVLHGGTQKGSSMESALESIKTRFKITSESNGCFEQNKLDGKTVSVAIFGAVKIS